MSVENNRNWIVQMFSNYGFTPPPGLIDALTSTGDPESQSGLAGFEVGAYINAFNEMQKFAANDPLTKLLVDEQNATAAAGTAADTYATELQGVYTQAPKLFGSLTPDQIDQYLAPTKTAFDYGMGTVTGEAAKRGVAGSSLEATAMAQADQQFKQSVLSQGLSVGMTEQQNMAGVLEGLYNSKINQQNLLYGLQQGTTGQMSAQALQNAEFMAQLPIYLQASANQQAAANPADNSSPWGDIASIGGEIAGGIGGFMLGGPMGAFAGANLGGQLGGGIASAAGAPPTPGGATGANALGMLPLLYGMMGRGGGGTSGPAFPQGFMPTGGLNWQSQPGYNTFGAGNSFMNNSPWLSLTQPNYGLLMGGQ